MKGTGLFSATKFPFARPLEFPNHPPLQSSLYIIYILDLVYFPPFACLRIRVCILYARTLSFLPRFDNFASRIEGVTISKLIKINIDPLYHALSLEDFSFTFSSFFLVDSCRFPFSRAAKLGKSFGRKFRLAEGRVNNRRDTSSSRRRSGSKLEKFRVWPK